MFRSLSVVAAVAVFSSAHALSADMVSVSSPHSVSVTMDRLTDAVTGAGATVFARVDHGAGAASVDMELPASQLLIFGNPKLGTPAMQQSATAGLDLPLRVLAYEDENGNVSIVYHAPATFAATHSLDPDAKYIQMMTGALAKLTGKAVAIE